MSVEANIRMQTQYLPAVGNNFRPAIETVTTGSK